MRAALLVLFTCALLTDFGCAPPRNVPMPPYPATRVSDITETIHGVSVADPYRWLEDGSSMEVKTWATAQDAVTRDVLSRLPAREAIAARLRELLYVEHVQAPVKRGDRYFIARRKAHEERWVVFWKLGRDGSERVLLDPNAWAADGSVSLGNWVPSWDGRKAAYQTKLNNSDEATLHVIDVDSGLVSDDIEGAKYAQASWTPTGDGFYYTWLPTDPSISVAERPGHAELRFHALGTHAATDRIIHPATGDSGTFLSGGISRDGRFLIVNIWHGWASSDASFMDLHAQAPAFISLTTDGTATSSVDAWDGHLYITTNEGAPRWRVFRVDPARPERASWELIVPECADATLGEAAIVGGKLALSYMKDVVSELEIRELDGSGMRQVALPGLGSASVLRGSPDDDEAYFTFTSFTQPTEIEKISVKTGEQSTWHRLALPVDPSKYAVDQVFITSKDGTRVPMFIIHAKDMKRDGKAPAILYGYGGFLVSQTPSFDASIYPWLEHGGVYAVVNLRGGGEYGENWHRAGMLLKKQNVFDDFFAAAEHLVSEGWTAKERLTISGESNGGLLVAAALTQRPELFRTVLCGVPLTDMVRFHLVGSGGTWVPEYGSADNPEQFQALLAYSPYHHVKKGTRYPAVLFASSADDDRVDPMHARKMTALLQAATTGGPVLLRVERSAGHGGGDTVRSWVDLVADQQAFALAQAL